MSYVMFLASLLALGSGGSAVIKNLSSEGSQPFTVASESSEQQESLATVSLEAPALGIIESATTTRQQAIDKALERFAGTVGRVEQDVEEGVSVWKIRIVNAEGVRADIEVSVETGAIVRFKTEDADERQSNEDEDKDEHQTSVSGQTEVTRDEATAIAQGKLGGDLEKIELESEDGILVWNVRIVKTDGAVVTRADIRIDAATGDIIRFRVRDISHQGSKKGEESPSQGDAHRSDRGEEMNRSGDDNRNDDKDNDEDSESQDDDRDGSDSGVSGRDHDED